MSTKPEVRTTIADLKSKAFDRKKGYAAVATSKNSKLIGSTPGSIEIIVDRVIRSPREDGTEAQGYQLSATNDGWVTKEKITLWMGEIDQSVTALDEERKEYLEPEKTGLSFGLHPVKNRIMLFVSPK